MFEVRRILAAAVFLVIAGCSPSITTQSDYNPQISFDGYQSWAFISENPMILQPGLPVDAVNPFLEQRAMDAIKGTLSAKGFRQVTDPEAADFVVSFTFGARDKIQVDSYPSGYNVGYGSWGRGRYYGMSAGTETRVRQYTEGVWAIDIFDVKTKEPAWHGFGRARLSTKERTQDEIAARARSASDQILADFPPGTAAK